MKPRFAFILLILLLACAAVLPAADVPRPEVFKIRVDDTIQPITAEYIDRAITAAEGSHATALLIELNTPGGLLTSTRNIVQHILESKVPVIVYVGPTGSYAASAGFFILESADVAAMAPGTNTGASHPVTLGGGKGGDDVMKQKMENDTAAFMRSFVSKRGRPVELAESAVLQSKSWTDQEALDLHLIDLVARDPQQLLEKLDGRTIQRFDGSSQQLHLKTATLRDFPMSLRQRIMSFLMDPNILFILFSVGMLALYAEFNHPGAVVPGVVGLILIVLSIFALNILPVRYTALSLIVLAFVLFALEAKFTTHGVLGLGGVACLVMGGLLLVDGPIPQMRVALVTALAVAIPLGLITMFLMSLVVQAHRNKVSTGPEAMLGAVAIAQGPLSPRGKVLLLGELWDAVSSEPVMSGQEVTVARIEGLLLHVKPLRAAQPTISASP
jgi:membrane-bound serine protease (ClpP class)